MKKTIINLIPIFCYYYNIFEDDINRGWCYNFAHCLKLLYNEKARLVYSCDHAWVEYNRKYYDCDHVNGTKKFDNIMMCWCGNCEDIRIKGFESFWKKNGKSKYDINLNKKIVKEYINQYGKPSH